MQRIDFIAANERATGPALYIKIRNKSKMDVRINNIFIEDPRGPLPFERIGNIRARLKKRTPGDHWLFFYEDMENLAVTLRRHGYSGLTRFKLVVRDGSGQLHKKTIELPDLEGWIHPTALKALEKSSQLPESRPASSEGEGSPRTPDAS